MTWDASNGRLGIGTNTPSAVLQSNNTTDGVHGLIIRTSGSPLPSFSLQDGDITLPNYSGLGVNPPIDANEVGRFGALGSSIGGLQILGFSNATDERAIFITAISGRTTATANPVMTFRSQKHNGSTSTTDLSSSDIGFAYVNGTTRIAQIMGSGNLLLQNGGTFTDSGERLQVTGNVKVVGSGATSATTALNVRNSASTNLLSVRNDGVITINTLSATGSITTSSAISGFSLSTSNTITGGTGSLGGLTSGNFDGFVFSNASFAPTSGNATIAGIRIAPTINQTGTANGITRGLYVNPTLTNAADFRAIETARGNIVFGNLPTSSAGLPTGAIWNDSGTIKIV
jgi:hypothetical protein